MSDAVEASPNGRPRPREPAAIFLDKAERGGYYLPMREMDSRRRRPMPQELNPRVRSLAARELASLFEAWVAEDTPNRERPENNNVLNKLDAARTEEKDLDADKRFKEAADILIKLDVVTQQEFDQLMGGE